MFVEHGLPPNNKQTKKKQKKNKRQKKKNATVAFKNTKQATLWAVDIHFKT